MNFRLFLIVTLLASIVTLPACVYRLDIPQGNRIDASVIAQLEIGMTRRQVEFLLGKPAITNPYHADVLITLSDSLFIALINRSYLKGFNR